MPIFPSPGKTFGALDSNHTFLPSFVAHQQRFGTAAWLTAAFIANLSLAPLSLAQPAPPAAAASAPDGATERVKRQTDNVYKWIKYFADQPRKAEPAKAAPKVEAPVAVVVKRSSSKPAEVAPEVEPVVAAAPVSESAPVPAPLPVVRPPPSAVPVAVVAPAPKATPVEEPDRPLVPVSVEEPTIPRELRNSTFQNKVVLSFTVQPDGSVTDPTVLSGTNRRLNKASMDAVLEWRFEPIRSARTTQIEFQFSQE